MRMRYFKVVERDDPKAEEMLYRIDTEEDVVFFWSQHFDSWYPSSVPSATFFLDELTKAYTIEDLEVTEIFADDLVVAQVESAL